MQVHRRLSHTSSSWPRATMRMASSTGCRVRIRCASTLDLPAGQDRFAILEEEQDMIGILSLSKDLTERTQLRYTTWRVKADGVNVYGPQLNLDRTISLRLPLGYDYEIADAAQAQGCLLLQWRQADQMPFGGHADVYFSLEPTTLLLKKVCRLKRPIVPGMIYIDRFPADLVADKYVNMPCFGTMIKTSKGAGGEQHWLSTLV